MDLWNAIARHISEASGESFRPQSKHSVGGGCINKAYRFDGGNRQYFVKTNRDEYVHMFEAEKRALSEIADSQTVRVPLPLCCGEYGDTCYLVMEFLDLSGRANMAQLGEQLATMHQITRPDYGWDIDNTIGSTPQPNEPSSDWIEFWREHRLGFQLQLAAKNGHFGQLQDLGEELLEIFPALFGNTAPPASMLHGDLWGGNCAAQADGTPVIFDPALYYGDREADIAMSRLFGGFGPDFYAAYNSAWPMEAGHEIRSTFYNLYHILNHLNLFGSSYYHQAIDMMRRLQSELR